MRKLMLYFGLVFGLAASVIAADEYCWVRRTFAWSGNGYRRTEVIPLFGDEFRIRYATEPRGGSLTVTLCDGVAKDPRKPVPVIAAAKLHNIGWKGFKGYKQVYLVIEGDPATEWIVEVDQYLDTIAEWRLRNYTGKLKPPTKKEATWAGSESIEWEYTPRVTPYQIYLTRTGETNVGAEVKTVEGEELLFSTHFNQTGVTTGWIASPAPVKIHIDASSSEWQLDILTY